VAIDRDAIARIDTCRLNRYLANSEMQAAWFLVEITGGIIANYRTSESDRIYADVPRELHSPGTILR
jgi:hypothetical protein